MKGPFEFSFAALTYVFPTSILIIRIGYKTNYVEASTVIDIILTIKVRWTCVVSNQLDTSSSIHKRYRRFHEAEEGEKQFHKSVVSLDVHISCQRRMQHIYYMLPLRIPALTLSQLCKNIDFQFNVPPVCAFSYP